MYIENMDSNESQSIQKNIDKIIEESGGNIEAVLNKIVEQEKKDLEVNHDPQKIIRQAGYYERDPRIAKFVKTRDKFTCQICGELGFEKENGERHIEVHHEVPLSEGGRDISSNLISVCPTCHAVIHYGIKKVLEERKGLRKT